MDKPNDKEYDITNPRKDEVDNMDGLKQAKKEKTKRMSDEARQGWKMTAGVLTDEVPHGVDGETVSDYISRMRYEEKKKQ